VNSIRKDPQIVSVYCRAFPDSLGGCSHSRTVPDVLQMASSDGKSDQQPENFRYYQIYASEDGTTHFKSCLMHGFELKKYAKDSQYQRSDFGGETSKLVFTELAPGLEQDLHCCPEVQFVVTLSGSWYVKTSDGTKHTFNPGDVLFQDNTKTSPASNKPQHYSGVVGDKPCQQMIVQISRAPEVDNPNPF